MNQNALTYNLLDLVGLEVTDEMPVDLVAYGSRQLLAFAEEILHSILTKFGDSAVESLFYSFRPGVFSDGDDLDWLRTNTLSNAGQVISHTHAFLVTEN